VHQDSVLKEDHKSLAICREGILVKNVVNGSREKGGDVHVKRGGRKATHTPSLDDIEHLWEFECEGATNDGIAQCLIDSGFEAAKVEQVKADEIGLKALSGGGGVSHARCLVFNL